MQLQIRLDFCGFFTGMRRSWGHVILTDFGTFKPLMLPQVGLNSGGVVRVDASGDFFVEGFDQLVWWGFLTGVIFSAKNGRFTLKLWISNLHSPISVQAGNTNPRNVLDKQRIWDFAAKNWLPNGIFGGALLVTFSDFFSSRKVKNFAAIRWPKPLQKAGFLGLGILRPKT